MQWGETNQMGVVCVVLSPIGFVRTVYNAKWNPAGFGMVAVIFVYPLLDDFLPKGVMFWYHVFIILDGNDTSCPDR